MSSSPVSASRVAAPAASSTRAASAGSSSVANAAPAHRAAAFLTAGAGAVLAVGVSVIHVLDQGGVTAFADPAWLGWAYRLLEVGGVVVAIALVVATAVRWTGGRMAVLWTLAGLVGLGPFVGYVLTRTTGLPGATDDIGHWGEPLGVASLVVEAVLVVIAIATVARSINSHTAFNSTTEGHRS